MHSNREKQIFKKEKLQFLFFSLDMSENFFSEINDTFYFTINMIIEL